MKISMSTTTAMVLALIASLLAITTIVALVVTNSNRSMTTPDANTYTVDEYIIDMHDTRSFNNASPDKLVSLGHQVCDLWEQGSTKEDAFNGLLDSDMTPQEQDDAIALIVSATMAFCPEYDYKMG